MDRKEIRKIFTLESRFEMIRTVIAIAIAILLAMIIIFLVSSTPILAIKKLIFGAIESKRRFTNVIELSIPLIFTGLSVTVMFKANQFNMISEGVFYIGGVIASIISINLVLPSIVHPIIAILISGIIGGLIAVIPSAIKLKWKASELVSSLMMNFILFNLGLYIINNYFRDINAGSMASVVFSDSSSLGNILKGTRLHYGIFIAIGSVFLTHFFISKTKWGYNLRITGENIKFANYSGINTTLVIIYSQFIGGFLASIGGAVEVIGMYDRFKWQELTNYGFDGIIVAILAKENPKLVPLAALFLAYIRIGADTMGSATDVSNEMIAIIQGVIIMLIAANGFMKKYQQKLVVKEAKKNG